MKEKRQALILQNSIYYFLKDVFILLQEKGCRLVVNHQGRILTDTVYKTVRGAKIAFNRIYSKKSWKEGGVKPEWSHAVDVEEQWLKERLPDPKNRRQE